jgi:hypothetical protein
MLQYTFKLKHDKGTITIRTIADNLEAAIIKVEKSENCPRNAIALKSILPVPDNIKKFII